MDRPVRQNWGGGQNLAPTERRIDPLAFILNSLILGFIVFCAVAWILWRPLPFLQLPPGKFIVHFTLAAMTLVHKYLPLYFGNEVRGYAAVSYTHLTLPTKRIV